MLLTPLFTPPLDTEIGKERMTVQLVDIEKEEGKYQFNFERLDWFMKFAEQCGVKYFEMPHLFTQWGAEFTPKIVALADGKEQKIFGWEKKALSKEYKEFLSAFLPSLRKWLIENRYYSRCYAEAAFIDGASHFTVFFRIMLPLVKTTFAALMLLSFISFWNDYYTPMIYLPSMPTLSYGLYYYSHSSGQGQSLIPMQLAACMIASFPIMILFLALRKRLMGSLTLGGLKG